MLLLAASCPCCNPSQDKAALDRQLKSISSRSSLLEKNLEKKDAQVRAFACSWVLPWGLEVLAWAGMLGSCPHRTFGSTLASSCIAVNAGLLFFSLHAHKFVDTPGRPLAGGEAA